MMPVIFIGHGSPMNAIKDNIYTQCWREIWEKIPKPKAIILFSAHWITEWYTAISTAENPEMIYDMYGFPPELYKVKYRAKGDPDLAKKIYSILAKQWTIQYLEDQSCHFKMDPTRWLDHGEWSILLHMFPETDIPVVSISLDYHIALDQLFEIGRALSPLRDEWVLIMWSGNIVHNLRAIDWSGTTIYPWARDFDKRIEENILKRNFADILNFESWSETKYAHPTVDHFLPLLPIIGASMEWDSPEFYNPDIAMGSLSMRSILWDQKMRSNKRSESS
jgi:4,5-DOPA dioxygenase extradiol